MGYRFTLHLSVRAEKENLNNTHATFLDMDITVEDKQYITKLYDKREDFPFDIVSYPDLSANIPTLPSYGVYIAQIIRIARVCSRLADCTIRVRQLTTKLTRQGFNLYLLQRMATKCLNKHSWITEKFKKSTRQIVYNIWDL